MIQDLCIIKKYLQKYGNNQNLILKKVIKSNVYRSPKGAPHLARGGTVPYESNWR